jgi:hypothetical protein
MMRPYGLALLVAMIVCCAAGYAPAQTAVPKADTQNWNDVQLAVPLNKKIDFVIQGTLRIGNNLTQPVDERWGVGWVFKVNKYLSLNPYYFHREARSPHGKPEREERLTMGASLRLPIKKFTLVERNLIEKRFREPQIDSWRYRNRVQLEHPFKIKKTKLTGFVYDEVFYDWSLHDWVRNRFGVGASHAFNKHFTGELYVMRQNDGRSRPGDINVIGTGLRFRM